MLAEYLAGGEANHALQSLLLLSGHQRIGGSQHIDPERAHGALDDRIDPRDSRAMDEVCGIGFGTGPTQALGIENITGDDLKIRVISKCFVLERITGEIVVDGNLVRIEELAAQSGADEPSTARYENSLAGQHCSWSPVYGLTWITEYCICARFVRSG